jgi:phage/plasmid-like protein (TIGR03299 family)
VPDYYDFGIATRTPSWHGKELVLAEHPRDWAHACELAGMFEVEMADLQLANGTKVDGWRAVVRTDTEAPIAVVADTYSLIDIRTMGEIIEETLEGSSWKIDTLFSLREGRMVAACIVLDEPMAVSGDFSKSYPLLTVSNGWTADHALSNSFTQVRAVCANTVLLSEMIASKDNARWVIKHTKNWRERVQALKAHLQFAQIAHRNLIDLQSEWATVAVAPAEQEKFYRTVTDLAFPRDLPLATAGLAPRNDWVEQLVHVGKMDSNEVWKGTVQGLWSTYTEWRDHFRPYRSDATLAGRQLVYGDPGKRIVFDMVSRMADTYRYIDEPTSWWEE